MTRNLRVSAVTPNFTWDDSPLPTDTLRPPRTTALEWAYLSASLGGVELSVTNAYARNLDIQRTVEEVLQTDPTHVVVSTVASILYYRCPPFSVRAPFRILEALDIAGFRGMTILVGPHATHSPLWSRTQTGAEVAWRGSTDLQLGQALLSDPSLASCAYADSAKSSGASVAVDLANSIPAANLRVEPASVEMPPHAWLLSDDESQLLGASKGLLLEASRGCPWSCAYCAKGPVRDKYSHRPIEALKQEIHEAEHLGYEYAFFIDETFNIPGAHLDAVLAILGDSKIKFGFQGRPDLITKQNASDLADAGCVYVELGVDVASTKQSHDLGRRQSLDTAERGVDACREAIPLVRFNRLNFSTNDYSEMYPEYVGGKAWSVPVDPVYPYPGSPLGESLMRRFDRESYDWEFAEVYSWWLRLEVRLQRDIPNLAPKALVALEAAFLSLPREVTSQIFGYMNGIAADPLVHSLNKAVQGHGGTLHLG